jgi:hypothetical protein
MFTEDSPYLQCLLETAEAGQLTRERVFSGDLTQLRNVWDIALHLKLIESSMFPDVPRVLTSAGRSALACLRERGNARPIPIAANSAKRKGGRPRLAEADPKFQAYQRIRRERQSGESLTAIQDRLQADKDFMELFNAGNLNWDTVFKNERAYSAQQGQKQENSSI